MSSKTLIGTLILPEIPFSGNSIKSSLKDKSCNIYSVNNLEKLVLIVSFQCSVPADRCQAVSKLLPGGQIVLDRVVIIDSIQPQRFRNKLSPDETYAYKLQTFAERKEIMNIMGTLCVSWPEFGNSAVLQLGPLLQKDVLPSLDFSSKGDKDQSLRFGWLNDLLNTEIYT
ncbi:hypothetical protein Ancab_018640 [Ancistrocladus abbreviatus]